MPITAAIIGPRLSVTSHQTTYFEKLSAQAKLAWQNFVFAKAVGRKQLDDQNKLADSNDPYLRTRANAFRFALAKMNDCQTKNPCGVFGCKRCGNKVVFEQAARVAAIASRYTTAQRGRAIAIVLTSHRWVGPARACGDRVEQDMLRLQLALKELPELEGYRLCLDASEDELARGSNRQLPLEQQHRAHYHLHIHGTLLVKGRLDRFRERLDTLLIRENIHIDTHLQYLKGSYQDPSGKARTNICSVKDVAAWVCYSEKLHNGGKLPPVCQRALQRELWDTRHSWEGGRLAEHQTNTTAIERVTQCRAEISNLQALHIRHKQNNLFASQYAELHAILDELTGHQQRAQERNRKRAARRTAAYRKLRDTFHPNCLRTRQADWQQRSLARRDKHKAHLRRQAKRQCVLWRKWDQTLARVLKTTARLLSRTPKRAANLLLDQINNPKPDSALHHLAHGITLCANLISCRKRLHGLMVALGQEQNRNNSRIVESITHLHQWLRDQHDFWPAWNPSDSPVRLDWSTFWRQWLATLTRPLV